MIALLKTTPALFLEDTPRKIKKPEKTKPIKESAFI